MARALRLPRHRGAAVSAGHWYYTGYWRFGYQRVPDDTGRWKTVYRWRWDDPA
jgi:hypothetical protein